MTKPSDAEQTCRFDHHGYCQEHFLDPAIFDNRCQTGLIIAMEDVGVDLDDYLIERYDNANRGIGYVREEQV